MTTAKLELPAINYANDLTALRPAKGTPTNILRKLMKENDQHPTAWMELPDSEYLRAIAESGWITPEGANIPDDATNEDIAICIKWSSANHKTDFWGTVDIIGWMRDKKYGGRIPKEDLEALAKAFDRSYKTLANYGTVYAAFPKAERLPEVKPSIYLKIVGVEDEGMRKWLLQEAAANNWTVETAGEKVKEYTAIGATVNEEGVLVQPDMSVLPAEGDAVVQTNTTISSQSGLAANVPVCIAKMIEDMVTDNGFTVASITDTLNKYAAAGMLKFPPRAWFVKGEGTTTDKATPKTNGKAPKPVLAPITVGDDEDDLPF